MERDAGVAVKTDRRIPVVREYDWDYWDDRWPVWPGRDATSIRGALAPLVENLSEYDRMRVEMEQSGGPVLKLKRLAAKLKAKIELGDGDRKRSVSLNDPAGLHSALVDVGGVDLVLNVRLLPHGMPVYYLCRTRGRWWTDYPFVIEEYHVSPGYPFHDARFVKLMQSGHEANHLRIAPFRGEIPRILGDDERDDSAVDRLISDLGNHVLQAAWHEDQWPGVAAAETFGMRRFKHAIELLYLCLSGELSGMRNRISGPLLRFFDEVYPQPAIRAFLPMLDAMDGGHTRDLPDRALNQVVRLGSAFSRFLNTETPWGKRGAMIPVSKILFANFSRLDAVKGRLLQDAAVVKAAAELDELSADVIENILKRAQPVTGS
jgi:hypothetical protein